MEIGKSSSENRCRSHVRSAIVSRRHLMAAIRLSRLSGVGARQFLELLKDDPDPLVALRNWRIHLRNRARTAQTACLSPTDGDMPGCRPQGRGSQSSVSSLAWLRHDAIHGGRKRRFAATDGCPQRQFGAMQTCLPKGDAFPGHPKSATRTGIAAAETWLKSGNGYGAFAGGRGYPARLFDLSEPPPIVFWRSPRRAGLFSDTWWLGREWVAIVGSRSPSPMAVAAVTRIVSSLADESRGVISGGARGIDAFAHRNALDMGMACFAVLGSGVDVVYPREHEELFAEVAKTGVLMSELLPGTAPRPGFFPTRNRLIAALADRVIIVQAGCGSGALITASWARRLGRSIEVLVPPPGSHGCPEWAGNHQLLDTGAIPIFPLIEPIFDVVAGLRGHSHSRR